MAGQDVSQWVGAEVTGVTVDDAGNNLVHLEFPDNCPYEVFRSAAWGTPFTEAEIAAHESCARCNAQGPCSPLMKARQTSSQGAFARLFGPINPTRKPPGSPQQDSPASSAPPQSQSGERTRSTESLLWSISTLINLLLVFLLGVVTALNYQNLRALWIQLGR